jgi:biotin transport system substrate-specific component
MSTSLFATAVLQPAPSTTSKTSSLRVLQQTGSVAFATVLTIAAAQISIPLPFTPVPFTFQPMVVLLCGAALGSRLGLSAQIVYLALGCAGWPVFAASAALPQGIARLLGPTGGYLMAYPAAAFAAGWLAERGLDRRYVTAVISMVCGLAIVFAGGVSWLAFAQRLGVTTALGVGFYPFIGADFMKLLIAAGVMPALWRVTGLRTPATRPPGD